MKVQKKISVQGEFAKIPDDIKDGDTITILDGGTEITSQYGPQNVYKIQTRNGPKILGINQTSVNALIDAFGDETEDWVKKTATAIVVKAMISGALKNVVYLAPEGFEMNNEGKIVRTGSDAAAEKTVDLDKEGVDKKDDTEFSKDIPF